MPFNKKISTDSKRIHHYTSSMWSSTRKLVFTAIISVIAAILQSAGGYFPGIGFFISPFTTLPIVIGIIVSFRYGLLTYILTACLLLLIEPTELFIFPFTTGLLGLSLGYSVTMLERRLGIILLNGWILCLGICIPLFILGFPVFGPSISSTLNVPGLLVIFFFSVLYSWLWLEISLFFVRRLSRFILPSHLG